MKPRLYDEALYVPYALPLLPGSDGVRVKSNNTAKLLAKNKYMETMINKNEQKTHLYEYYSGVETPKTQTITLWIQNLKMSTAIHHLNHQNLNILPFRD